MSTTIELPTSAMQVKYRVVARRSDGEETMISSWSEYSRAEEACWRYPAVDYRYELYIEKVWIKK